SAQGVACQTLAVLFRRSVMLLVGLSLFGISLGLVVRAGLGLAPWDVFHEGVSERLDLSLGTVIVATSFVVLLLWIPLRERPGVGTIGNAILVGVWVDITMAVIPEIDGALIGRVALLLLGVSINGLATGLYIGAGMGSGPRDGLMTGIASRGHSIRAVRTSIEAIVLVTGFALGGTIGVGTLLYAFAIGPIAHKTIPWFVRLSGRDARGLLVEQH
ncbi:MAG: hypothetical protein O2886_07950, partial [Actinomycetota bacterium]|nr:hypothetical protein [Actinomycetota bacterium]